MNYLTLINQFWAKDLEHSFTPNDIAVYFRLLERCNALGWKNPFNFSVDELLMKLRLKTKDPLDTARNRLKQAGLIDFKNGQGRGYVTSYWLAAPEMEEENPSEKGKKNTPFMPPFSPTFSPPFLPPEEPLVHKTKLNKTKPKRATALGAAPSASKTDTSSAIDPALLDWQAWADREAPQVLKLKTQPTGAELTRLYEAFGREQVLAIFSEMDNYAPLLKKYTSAVKTCRDWCKRRANDPKSGKSTATAAPKSLADKLHTQRSNVPV